MASFKDSFSDLERHRKTLEENVQKLRKSLNDWRLWELDYEALKEEVAALPSPPHPKDLAKLHEGWEGIVLTKSEALEIIFGKAGKAHTSAQIVQLLSRRIDYVSDNVRTLERQLEAAENKLAAATVISMPDALDEDGLPITEIIEELDDDDNVLSHQLRTAGDAQPQLLEALDRAGVKDLVAGVEPQAAEQCNLHGDTEMADAEHATPETKPPKKGVSFAEDTKPGHDAAPGNDTKKSYNSGRLNEITQMAVDHDQMDLSNAVIPVDESEEDAKLRREMLEYSMSEIGPVVAELNLEEGDDDDFGEDYDYSDEEGEDEDEEDEVDHLGRSRYSVITDDYRQRMMALERKLGLNGYFTTDDPDDAEEPEVRDHGIGRISVAKRGTAASGDTEEVTEAKFSSGRKGVRFANELDIAPADTTPVYDPIHGQVRTSVEHNADPLSDIVERSSSKTSDSTNLAGAEPPTKKRVSRFKKDRAMPSNTSGTHSSMFPDQPLPFRPACSSEAKLPAGPLDAPSRFLDQPLPFRPAPTGPDGQTLANQVIERDTVHGSAVEPDEWDATMMHREVSEEYHRRRNRMIMKEGGFGQEEERAVERMEVDDGKEEEQPRRVSRFKAARLGR